MKFEWSLAAFGLGICVYFAWPAEPLWWMSFLVLLCMAVGLVFARKYIRMGEWVLLALFCIAGFSRGALHTHNVSQPILTSSERFYEVSGWIENINKSGPLQHYYMRVQTIKDLPVAQTPYRVRIRLKPDEHNAGDSIRIRAVLRGPRGPVLTHGYDPARAAYYKKIGGFGFAISKPETIPLMPLSTMDRLKRRLVIFRFALSRRIQESAPPNTAGLQSALLTGDRSAIPYAQERSLRASGLAHLLAISGLHMGLLAGGVYSLASLLLAMMGPLARRYDMRKYAAFLGGVTAFAYLLLSGASVSTQRAFIMAFIMFAAIILNRRAVSLRSVAVAAGVTLMLHPESLLSAGFQMSFAATTALVVVYRSWADHRIYKHTTGLFSRFRNGFVGLSVTSIVAGVATGGFAALHFHRFARLGLFANLAAMPVFTFIVMPAGFLSLLLVPFGLEGFALKIMGLGLDYVLMVADWISNRKLAILHIKGANGLVISVFGFGFIGLCFGGYARQKMAAFIGVILLVTSFAVWSGIGRADMRISDTGRIAYWDTGTANVLWVDNKRGDKFGRGRFVETAGVGQAEYQNYKETEALCDMQACRIKLKGKTISIVNAPEGVEEACMDSDLVVLTNRNVGVRARRLCAALLIDRKDLMTGGARDIYIGKQGISIRNAHSKSRQNRPWG